MWIMTGRGFFSVVAHTQNKDWVLVRARCQKDIENFRADIGYPENSIIATPSNDYPYRIVAWRHDWVNWMLAQAEGIEYSNFKSHIGTLPDQKDKLNAYHDVWATMRREVQFPPSTRYGARRERTLL